MIRPRNFQDLSFNEDVSHKLKNIGLSNYIIYGGTGKLTRVNCYLVHNFNENIYKTKLNTYSLTKNLDIIYKASNYHIEINPSNYGTNDKTIISLFIGDLATSPNVINNTVKVFVIKDADKLTLKAQTILKNLIEKTYRTARYILICSNIVRITESLKSRFFTIRNPQPDTKVVSNILKNIADQLKIKTSTRAINIIIENSQKLNGTISLKHAINIFQMSYIIEKYTKYENNFTHYIDKLISNIKNNDIQKIRELIYTIYVSNMDMSVIMKYIVRNLIKDYDDKKYQIIILGAKYECLMKSGNKEPLYLETFILHLQDLL